MLANEKEITLASCEGCELGNVLIGGDWLIAHEAVTSLSSVYPVDNKGNLVKLNHTQLDEIRKTEIQEWREEGEFGNKVADFLERVPSIVGANYNCDLRRQIGKCGLRLQINR